MLHVSEIFLKGCKTTKNVSEHMLKRKKSLLMSKNRIGGNEKLYNEINNRYKVPVYISILQLM